jgi:hypothetical protein
MSDESNPLSPDPNVRFDRENAFQLFAMFAGDVERTAHSLNVRPIDVLRTAEDEGWLLKLQPILELKKSKRPGDIDRGLNRARNFVQALRLTMFLERVLKKLMDMPQDEMEEYLFQVVKTKHKDGTESEERKLSTRSLADLTSAIEKAHAMSYLALNDTVQDRTKRQEHSEDPDALGALNVAVAQAMASVLQSNTPRALIFDAQLKLAQSIEKAALPAAPYDKDG